MTETLGMIVHRLKIKTYKVLEVHGIFVRFDKIFMGSVFWVTLNHCCCHKQ